MGWSLSDVQKLAEKPNRLGQSAKKALANARKEKSASVKKLNKNKQAKNTIPSDNEQKSRVPALAVRLRQCGVPEFRWAEHPEGEYYFHPRRRWRFDIYFPGYDFAVEVEGGVAGHMRYGKDSQSRHLTPKGYEEDRVKYFEAGMLDIFVQPVTPAMVDDDRAASMVVQYLMKKGWRPQTRSQITATEACAAQIRN